jgi:hypothetical protein
LDYLFSSLIGDPNIGKEVLTYMLDLSKFNINFSSIVGETGGFSVMHDGTVPKLTPNDISEIMGV